MIVKNADNFQGKNNKRLNQCEPTNKEGTAAWQDCEMKYRTDQVSKPSEDQVIDAKDWVDNGSML